MSKQTDCEHSFDSVTDECARCGLPAPTDEYTVFRIVPTDAGRFLVTERQLGSRMSAFVASLETRAEAEAWIAAATSSDYRETGLIFPSLTDAAYGTRPCVHCGGPCKFLLCDDCHQDATSDGFVDDGPTLYRDVFIPEVGLPVCVDGIHRFG